MAETGRSELKKVVMLASLSSFFSPSQVLYIPIIFFFHFVSGCPV